MSTSTATANTKPERVVDQGGVKILAKSVYRQLKENGASRSDIVSFTNTMLELVTTDINSDQ